MSTRGTRLSIAGQVVLMLLLAVAGAALVIHLSQRRGMRVRTDWTFDARNTLAPETIELLAALPEEAQVDVFLRAMPPPLDRVWADASGLLRELLTLAESHAPDKLDVTFHDVLADFEAVQPIAQRLGVREDNVFVVSIGERRAMMRLWGGVAEIDPGSNDPQRPIPPSLHRFRGQEALCEALVKVTVSDRPVACFSTGHAEPDPFAADEPASTARLAGELTAEGFEVRSWDPEVEGGVPEDCDLLLVLAPDQPFRPQHLDDIEAWVAGGGRLLCATGPALVDEEGSAGDLLARFGMPVARGFISVPYMDPFTRELRQSSTLCADFAVMGEDMNRDSEITAPLVEGRQRVSFVLARSFARLQGTGARALLPLLHSPLYSWRDLPGNDGIPNFEFEPEREEAGRFTLAALARLTPTSGPRVDPETGAALEGRVVGIACHNVVLDHAWGSNRSFLSNAVDWLVDRQLNILVTGITDAEREDPRIDVVRGGEYSVVYNASVWGLPPVCLFLGVAVFLWRRRG